MRRFLLCLLCVALVCSQAFAVPAPTPGIGVELVEIAENGGRIAYPQLIHHPDQRVQDAINRAIMERARIAEHAATLSTLTAGGTGLAVTAQAALYPASGAPCVLTVLVEARGRMPNGRPGVSAEPMMFRLDDGQSIAGDALFADRTRAQEAIDAYIEQTIVPELSTYLDPFLLTPAPLDRVAADAIGITLYYPAEDFVTLSGRGVAVHLAYQEIMDIWDFKPGGALAMMGITENTLAVQPDSAQAIRRAAEDGALPGIPARLGDAMEPLAEQYGEPIDPEYFPNGDKHQLEGAAFRSAWVVSQQGVTGAVITGIVSHRLPLFGLVPGRSVRAECEELLGAAHTALPLDAGAAAAYGFPEGTLTTYSFNGNNLHFAYGQDDVLAAIWLEAAQAHTGE